VLFCGIPGSGKTTIASALSQKMPRAMLVQTDRIRSMLSRPTFASSESKFVYGTLVSVAEDALRAGYDTLLEGTFPRREYRREALDALSPMASKVLVVHVFCDPALAFGRNAGREQAVPWESFLRIYRQFEDPADALRIDTSNLTPEDAVEKILSAIRR
jgi:hypothetical protein